MELPDLTPSNIIIEKPSPKPDVIKIPPKPDPVPIPDPKPLPIIIPTARPDCVSVTFETMNLISKFLKQMPFKGVYANPDGVKILINQDLHPDKDQILILPRE